MTLEGLTCGMMLSQSSFYCTIIKDLKYHCEKIGNNAKNLHLCKLFSNGVIQLNEYKNLIL
jgi:hypothetical protein